MNARHFYHFGALVAVIFSQASVTIAEESSSDTGDEYWGKRYPSLIMQDACPNTDWTDLPTVTIDEDGNELSSQSLEPDQCYVTLRNECTIVRRLISCGN